MAIATIEIFWNPIPHLGPVPINWYGLGWVVAFLCASSMIRRWARREELPVEKIEGLLLWVLVGAMGGARLYFVVQNDFASYLREPWRVFAIWEGGLAFFGGLFGATLAGNLYARARALPFARVADLVAPAVPIAGAIGRIACGLDGMDYGKPTSLPWGVIYTHPASYAPNDGIARHPVQFYELAGDLVIAAALLKLRGRVPEGALFLTYLVLFGTFRFALFFARGDVPAVALGLSNGHWTALGVVLVAVPILVLVTRRRRLVTRSQSEDRLL